MVTFKFAASGKAKLLVLPHTGSNIKDQDEGSWAYLKRGTKNDNDDDDDDNDDDDDDNDD